MVIDFEAFQETRIGLHITDYDAKEIYVPGTAHDDKEQHSFPVRVGVIRALSDDGLIDQTSHDALPDVSWAEDIISAMDSFDPHQVVDPAGPIPDIAAEKDADYFEVRGLYLYRVHVKPRTTRCSPFELSEMLP